MKQSTEQQAPLYPGLDLRIQNDRSALWSTLHLVVLFKWRPTFRDPLALFVVVLGHGAYDYCVLVGESWLVGW